MREGERGEKTGFQEVVRYFYFFESRRSKNCENEFSICLKKKREKRMNQKKCQPNI